MNAISTHPLLDKKNEGIHQEEDKFLQRVPLLDIYRDEHVQCVVSNEQE